MTFCISQGSAVTLCRRGGQIYNPMVSNFLRVSCTKNHSNIPNDCQDFANLLLGYFHLAHPRNTGIEKEKTNSYSPWARGVPHAPPPNICTRGSFSSLGCTLTDFLCSQKKLGRTIVLGLIN